MQSKNLFWIILVFLIALTFLSHSWLKDGGEPEQPSAKEQPQIPTESEMLKLIEKAAQDSILFSAVSFIFLLALTLGIGIDLQFLWRFSRKRFSGRLSDVQTSWGLMDIVRVVIIFLAAFIALHSIYPIWESCCGEMSEISMALIFQFLAEIVALAYLVGMVHGSIKRRFSLLGFRRGRFPRQIGSGVKAYMGFFPILLLLTWLTQLAADLMGIKLEPQEQIGFFFAPLSSPVMVFLVFFIALIGPIFEEMFFRGFAYQAFRRRWGRIPAVMITALLFSALHANLSVFLPITGLGILLALAFELNGSIVPSIMIHICQNSVAVIGAMLIKILIARSV